MGVVCGSEINFGSKIGENVKFEHPIGIVIGLGVTIHDNVIIYQNVTLGNHGKPNVAPSYPTMNSGVVISANSSVIGNVTVGENSIIGAHSLVTRDVPPNCTVAGVPARVISESNTKRLKKLIG